ncbi:hypothetical protein [Jannaschia sp. R86511]|uniref:hypothetical protein n=1 Tax=Jannaschia sp. R86511 TaxID=3093853 RepID=UPI0036D3B815
MAAAPPPAAASTAAGRARGTARTWSVRTWLLLAVPSACVVALVATLLSPWGPSLGAPGGVALDLPGSVAGLDARADGPSRDGADALAERLRDDPAVAGVAVRAYDGDGLSLVLLRLSPRRPFDDVTAGRLTAEVLGATAGSEPASRSTSADGEALISCTPATATSATCVAVQSDEALLVITSGEVADPVALTARVRDAVQAG